MIHLTTDKSELLIFRGYDARLDELRRKGHIALRVSESECFGSDVVGRGSLTNEGREVWGDLSTLADCEGSETVLARKKRQADGLAALARQPRSRNEAGLTSTDVRAMRELGLIKYDASARVWCAT